MSHLRILAPLTLAILLLVSVLSGCCDDCDCTQPTPVDPSAGLVDTWECVSYLQNDIPQEGQVGLLMAFEDDGTGYMADPSGTPGGSFIWAATDSTVYIEEQSMGLATGFHYKLSGDSLYTWAEVSFIGPLTRFDITYVRWEEPAE